MPPRQVFRKVSARVKARPDPESKRMYIRGTHSNSKEDGIPHEEGYPSNEVGQCGVRLELPRTKKYVAKEDRPITAKVAT